MKTYLIYPLCLLLVAGCGLTPGDIASSIPQAATATTVARTPTLKPSPTVTPSSTPIAGRFRPVTLIDDVVPGSIQRLYPSSDGALWLITDEVAAKWMDTNWSFYLSDYSGTLVGIDQSERVWVVSEDTTEISAWDGETWTIYATKTGWKTFPDWFGLDAWVQFDELGRFWLNTSQDVRLFDGTRWTVFGPQDMDMDPPSYEDVRSSFEITILDSTGEIWVGECDWAGPGPIGGQGARWYDGQTWHGTDSPVASGCVTAIEEDRLGRIWIGVEDTLWRYDPSKTAWVSFTPPEPPPMEPRYGYITDLVLDPDGEPWLNFTLCGGASCSSKTIAFHLHDGVWNPVIESDEFGLQKFILDAEGTLWLFWDASVYRIEEGELEFMAELFPQQVTVDANGRVWFVARYEGQSALWTIETESGLPPSAAIGEGQPGSTSTPTSSTSPTTNCPQPSGRTVSISPINPGTTVTEGFEPQLQEYLNARGSADGLEEVLGGLTFNDSSTIWESKSQVMTIDVTGDQIPEVLIDLIFFVEGQYADGAIFVFACRDGRYQGGAMTAIGGQIFSADDPGPGIRAIKDMNRDGVPEIVYSYIEIIGTHANFTRVFKIATWDGTGFVDLVQSDSYDLTAVQVYNGDGEIIDTDGDGTFELVVSHNVGRGPDASPLDRARTEIWAWDGSAITLACSEAEGVPVFRFQAFQDGDDATRCGNYEGALAFYQQAVFDEKLLGWSQGRMADASFYTATPTPDPNERPRINAYGRYRIMLLHVAQGHLSEAEIVYHTLIEKYPEGVIGSQYAELATVFWNSYRESQDIGVACEAATEYATMNDDLILSPLGSDFYGFYSRDYSPDDICPFK